MTGRSHIPPGCVVVTGPTATGKTRLAVALARAFDGEIIGADSRQVYRGMDIGTGKDLGEYGSGEARIPCHLIDVAAPTEEYNLHRFLDDATEAFLRIRSRNHLPLVVGGTPLYIHALVSGYELRGTGRDPRLRAELAELETRELLEILRHESPERFSRTDKSQRPRILRAIEIARTEKQAGPFPPAAPWSGVRFLVLAPFYPRPVIHTRIEDRLRHRLRQGMLVEVERLRRDGLSWEKLEYFGLEYRWSARYLRGGMTHDEYFRRLLARIRRFCRSQEIWFRKMEREGVAIHWLPGGDLGEAKGLVETFLQGKPVPAPAIQLKDRLYEKRTSRPADRKTLP